MKPLVDMTVINGVESLFRAGDRDPWGTDLIGQFADAVVFSDRIRIPFPTPVPDADWRERHRPMLIKELESREPGLFEPVVLDTSEPFHIDQDVSVEAIETLARWANLAGHEQPIRRWTFTHKSPWVRVGHISRIPNQLVFDRGELGIQAHAARVANRTQLELEDVFYLFDVALRYTLYGGLVGTDEHYLNHPIRTKTVVKGQTLWDREFPALCCHFAESVRDVHKGMSLPEFATFLVELRARVQSSELHRLGSGEASRHELRRIAQEMRFAPYLSGFGMVTNALSKTLSAAGSLGSPASAQGAVTKGVGAAAGALGGIWKGRLPRRANEWSWMNWAFRYPIESFGSAESQR